MKDFIHNVLTELKSNPTTSGNSLVSMVIESVDKSINNKESDTVIYNELKKGLTGINEHLKMDAITGLLSQFEKTETTTDSTINEMHKAGKLAERLTAIKESNAYSNPVIVGKVDKFIELLENNIEFTLYPDFVGEFSSHLDEAEVKAEVEGISTYLAENAKPLEVMFSLVQMTGINERTYSTIAEELKEMLINEAYSADTINIKFGDSGLPLINNLVNNLRILESSSDDSFTLGGGDGNTAISSTMAPSIKTKSGSVVSFIDDRFIRISESTKSIKGDTVHIKEDGFIIATADAEQIKRTQPNFYNVCEAFARLGFKQEGSVLESTLIRNFKIKLAMNESEDLDLYLNESKVESVDSINITEALAMEAPLVKGYVKSILENLDLILNLNFIKNVSNHVTLSESSVFELNGNYFLCKKPDAANREWNKVDEHEMYTYFKESCNYDISAIFKDAINESVELKRAVASRKTAILENIAKLEGSIAEVDTALTAKSLQDGAIPKLEKVKESLEANIAKFKEEFIQLDLSKEEASA